MTDHVLKTLPPYFEDILKGNVSYTLRVNDRGFQKGDRLFLWEYDKEARGGLGGAPCGAYPCDYHRPRAVKARVSHVAAADPRHLFKDSLGVGWVIVSLEKVEEVIHP